MTDAAPDPIARIAAEALAAIDSHRSIAPFTSRPAGLSLADSYRVPPLLRAAFEARGERILGRKIGFTNRNIWNQYGVHAPIWGTMTDKTVADLVATPSVRTADFAEPRIEPEIVFGLASAPTPDMDPAALLDCIGWLAAGYEVVQSIFPAWKFAPADTVAANGLHGALLVGPRHAVTSRKAEWRRELSAFTIELSCDGKVIDRGAAQNVLDGPLFALRHLAAMLSQDKVNAPLAAGDIISTGTLTKAFPVAAGESWTATFTGIPLGPITLGFV